jgi:hypothetical protein
MSVSASRLNSGHWSTRLLKYLRISTFRSHGSRCSPAAGLVISAPIAIIDPETQDHYGDQFAQSIQQIKNSEPLFALGRNQLFGACRRMTAPGRFSDAGPSLTIAVRGDRAGIRKPPRKETASRKGIAAAATYGDLRVAGVCYRAVGMTIKDDFEG